MKTISTLFIALMIGVVAMLQTLSAQIPVLSIRSGDSLILNIGNYTQKPTDAISWKRSPNLTAWSTIAAGTGKTVLRWKPDKPYYYRMEVQDADCPQTYYSDTLQVNFYQKWAGSTYKLNGGRGYVHPYVSSGAGLSNSQNGNLSSWSNANRKMVWYIWQQAGVYDFGFVLTLSSNQTRDFKLTCTSTDAAWALDTLQTEFSYTGRGSRDTLNVMAVDIPKTGYFRYELESKTTNGSITIYDLLLTGYSTPQRVINTDPHTTDYLSSPSVHLHYTTADASAGNGNSYEWFYQEVLVPSTDVSPIYTYWESIGFSGGYLGLQNNTNTERRILFSVWDQIDVDAYNAAGRTPPPDSLVSLVDKAPYITSNGFGNEGTGGQSYFAHAKTWREGYPVRFLFNVRRDTDTCTICASKQKPTVILSAWYCAYDPNDATLTDVPDSIKGWRYIASWRRPFVSALQGPTGSFIENFGWSNGNLVRKGYYYNTWGWHTSLKKWIHFNKCTGTNTDGDAGQRIDYEHGVSSDTGHTDKFYMLSGGYGNTKKGTAYTVPLQTIDNFADLRDLDLQPFIHRVDSAMEVEKALRNQTYSTKDKSAWTLKYYSSQETSGEGAVNGRAATIIDDNTATYWHSAWYSGTSSYPHVLVFDMAQQETINGVVFTLSGGENRYMKNISIGVSDSFSGAQTGTNANATDDANWTIVWQGDSPNSASPSIQLQQPAVGQYIRLKINSGWGDGSVHTRINEMSVY
ncbi:MAG: DUF3472 domain-containing protein [Candidatus Symbiothrix sp.]|jgi:hypothetical protein|nr:DUF3472 domain-containing protein [Candidatus Symbiothrix sp.]